MTQSARRIILISLGALSITPWKLLLGIVLKKEKNVFEARVAYYQFNQIVICSEFNII